MRQLLRGGAEWEGGSGSSTNPTADGSATSEDSRQWRCLDRELQELRALRQGDGLRATHCPTRRRRWPTSVRSWTRSSVSSTTAAAPVSHSGPSKCCERIKTHTNTDERGRQTRHHSKQEYLSCAHAPPRKPSLTPLGNPKPASELGRAVHAAGNVGGASLDSVLFSISSATLFQMS
jgi:hypothetical protein